MLNFAFALVEKIYNKIKLYDRQSEVTIVL